MKTIEKLEWGTFNGFGNRKKTGRLSILVDVNSKQIYPVPLKQEHIDFANRVKGISGLEKLIPSHIDIEEWSGVIRVITGICGMEINFGIRHTSEDVERAHRIAVDYVKNGEISYESLKEEIIYRYCDN